MKCVVFIPVKIRPVEDKVADAQVWSVGERRVVKRGMESIVWVAVVIRDFSRGLRGRGMVLFGAGEGIWVWRVDRSGTGWFGDGGGVWS